MPARKKSNFRKARDFEKTNDTSSTRAKSDANSIIILDEFDKSSNSSIHEPNKKTILLDKEEKNQQEIIDSESIRNDDDCILFKPPSEQWQSEVTSDIGIPYPTTDIEYDGINTPLVQNSFATRSIFGDGNCYFRSISYVLFGTEDHHVAIRRLIVDYMKQHRDLVMQYMDNPRTRRERSLTQSELFDRHLENMSNPGSDPKHWGTQMEIIATASLFRTNIYVYHVSSGHSTKNPIWSWNKYQSVTLLGENAETPRTGNIYLHNARSLHYDVVTASTSNVLRNDSDLDSKNEQNMAAREPCLNCSRLFKSIKMHISKQPDCKQFYSNTDETREAYKRRKQAEYRENETDINAAKRIRYQQKYDKDHKTQIAQKQQTYNTDHKEQIAKKQKTYDTDHKEQIAKKQKTYNTDHKEQIAKKQKTYNTDHKEQIAKKQKTYNTDHKEQIAKKQKTYDTDHKEQIAKKQKTYDTDHKEQIAKKQKTYNTDHKEQIALKQKTYDTDHKEQIVQKQKAYNKIHKEQITQKQKQYNETNRDVIASSKKRYDKTLKENTDESKRLQKFREDVKYGPIFPCSVCHRMLYKAGVRIVNEALLKKINNKNMFDHCVTDLPPPKTKTDQQDKPVYVCHTCICHLTKNKMPPMCVKNGLFLDDIPEELRLSDLGQVLIAKSILFFKFFKLPKTRWSAIRDKVVHVPITDDDILATLSSLTSLPRTPDQAGLIPVKLKRKIEYKNYEMEAFIDPKKLIDAIMVLKDLGHPGYKDVKINEYFTKLMEDKESINEMKRDDRDPNESDGDINLNASVENMDTDEIGDNDDEYTDNKNDDKDSDDEDNNIRRFQSNDLATMMSDDHPEIRVTSNNKSSTSSLSVAPGEGKIPTNLMREDDWDVNSFPTLFPTGKYGINYSRAIKMAPWKYICQRLYNVDKRFISSNPYLFSGLYHLERHQIEQQINVSYLKGNVSKTGQLKGIEDALSVLEQIPGSPRYWRKQRNIMFAKLENLGPFLFFYTLSCADKRWTENFTSVFAQKGYKITYEMNSNEEIIYVNGECLEDILKRENPHELLRENIDIVTRNFNQRVRAFVKNVMMGANNPMHIEFYNYRVEFQARGAGHIHGVAWPKFEELEKNFPGITQALESIRNHEPLNIEKQNVVVKLIDAFISCSLQTDLRETVMDVQVHRHSKSCRKYGTKCRFNFPRYPSERTLIAQPLDRSDFETDEMYNEEISKHQNVLQSVKEVLIDLEEKDKLNDTSISDMMALARVTSDEYYKALEISNKGIVVILKRELNEMYVNNYNPEWLRAWNGNMDIQICLDYYAVITYITDYYMKDDSGTMKFLLDAAKECRGRELKDQMRFLANVFLTHRGKGTFEALYSIDPSLHLTDSNIKSIWVDTNFPDKRRQFLTKISDDDDHEEDPAMNILDENESGDENDEEKNRSVSSQLYVTIPGKKGKYVKRNLSLHDKYQLRPDALSVLSFAQFCTMYDTYSRGRIDMKDKLLVNGVYGTSEIRIATADENCLTKLPAIIKINSSVYMKLRGKPSVMRQRKPKEDKESHEYAYSELLLYIPWREESELHYDDFEKCLDMYENKLNDICAVKNILFPHRNNVEAGRAFIESLDDPRANHIGAILDPTMEQEQEDQKAIGEELDDNYLARNPEGIVDVNTEANKTDIGSIYRRIDVSDRDRMRDDVRNLDPDQRYTFNKLVEYFKNVKKASKLGKRVVDPPLYIVHGGGGNGKSLLIRVISEWAEAILRTDDDRNPDQPVVMLTSFTGTAASNIKGLTLHTAFSLPFGNKYSSLSDKKRDETRTLLEKVKLLIIDEISMVKSDQLYQLNLRLQEIMGNQLDFGGIAVLLFGDLLQLKPVMARYIFEKPSNKKFATSYDFRSLWDLFSSIELRYNHRQGEHREYAESLGRIRYGLTEQKDMDMMTARVMRNVPIEGIHLFGTNAEVNDFNDVRLKEQPGVERTILAINIHPTQQRYTPRIANDRSVNGTPFQNILKMKIGARVILTYNIDIKDRLVNGASGIVRDIILKPNTDQVWEVLVEFDDNDVGKMTRDEQKRKDNFVSIKKMTYSYSIGSKSTDNTTQVKVIQFPLKLAWGSTVHKFQGQTIVSPTILVGHMEKIRDSSQAYVLFGRVQTIEQLYLTRFKKEMIHVHKGALAQAKRIATEALNVQTIPWLEDTPTTIKVIQLNIRSLRKHYEDIMYDADVLCADIICLSETWIHENENQIAKEFSINGYQMISCSAGRGKGVILYTKYDVAYSENVEKINDPNFQILRVKHSNFDIICVYRSEHSTIKEFISSLVKLIRPNRRTVIVGDVNINALDNDVLEAALKSFDMKQIIKEPTHIDGGLLDHVYVNFEYLDQCIHPLYYSDHDGTCLSFMH